MRPAPRWRSAVSHPTAVCIITVIITGTLAVIIIIITMLTTGTIIVRFSFDRSDCLLLREVLRRPARFGQVLALVLARGSARNTRQCAVSKMNTCTCYLYIRGHCLYVFLAAHVKSHMHTILNFEQLAVRAAGSSGSVDHCECTNW